MSNLDPSYSSPSAAPVPKVTAAGVGGAVSTIVLLVLNRATKLDLDAEAGAAIATLAAFLLGYLTPPRGLRSDPRTDSTGG